jgi:hypothetical protein
VSDLLERLKAALAALRGYPPFERFIAPKN